MTQIDGEVGQRVVLAATERSKVFPGLLARAYAPLFTPYFNDSEQEASAALVAAEAVFRQIMAAQGQMLQQDLPVALDQLAGLNAQMAEGFLAQYGVVLPEDFDAKGLISTLIAAGMMLCQADFEEEVRATVEAVRENLVQYGYRFPQY
jgi:redox-regulated HSP33 family molecular chaperone